jgi:hypothetical protein
MDPTARQRAIDLYDRFTHEGMERRAVMAEMVKLAGSIAAAELVIAGIAASPPRPAIVAENDPHLTTRTQELAGGYKAYVAEPRTPLAQGHGFGHSREPGPQRSYPRRCAPGRSRRLPRRCARHAFAVRRNSSQ